MPHTLHIVTGMHRSGTSLIARMLPVYGISLPGELAGPAADNEKGFFEDRAIVDLNDRVFDKLDLRWDSLDGFFLDKSAFSSPRFNRLKQEARQLLEDRIALEQDWAFKDPRVARLLSFWLPLIDALNLPVKFIVAIRDPAEVAGSLASRNHTPHLKSLYLWLFYNLDLLASTQGRARYLVDYSRLLAAPEEVMSTLEQGLGDTLPEEKAEFLQVFMSPALHHHQELVPDFELEPASRLHAALKSGEPEAALVARQVSELQSRTDLQALLSTLSGEDRRWQAALQQQHDELASTITRRDGEITVFRDYQAKLQADLDAAHRWGEKLGRDVEAVTADIAALQLSIADKNQALDASSAEAERLARELQSEQAAFEQESMRLWAIIEKYRLQVEQMESSHSWKLTAPLRWARRAPASAWRVCKRIIHAAVFRLPADSLVRQYLVKVYERLQFMIHGDIDSHSIRASHKDVIADRWYLLGEKRLLADDELPEIDISIVTYNSSRWIEAFHASLVAQDYPCSKIHLAIVDNGSTDETVDRLEQSDWAAFAGVRILRSDNRGYGAGHNRGISEGHCALVLVTNVDLEFRADSLRSAVSFAVQDTATIASWELRQAPFEHPKFYDPVSLLTGWSSHACILMRRAAFEQVGGYEQRIFMYGEDVELSYRFRSAGFKLRYLPRACVEHHSYENAGEVKPLQYKGSTLANAYIRLRYGSFADGLKILPLYARLLTGRSGVADHRALVWHNVGSILKNAGYFVRRRSATGHFSFRQWDYDIVREGAFHAAKQLPADVPLVSVITRTYSGREALLLQCMQSVAHQTYPRVQHVIVEDGGDTLSDAVESFRLQYPEADIAYKSLPKVGRCLAGNEGLALSAGEYLVFLDDDDLFFADHLESCVIEMIGDTALGAVYGLAWEVETEFDGQGYEERSHGTPSILHQHFDLETLHHHNFIPIQSIVFRRSLFERAGGFDPDLENLEDWNLWVRYANLAPFKLIEKTTSMYRTPWDLTEKSRRQAVLDEYLPIAMARNEQALQ